MSTNTITAFAKSNKNILLFKLPALILFIVILYLTHSFAFFYKNFLFVEWVRWEYLLLLVLFFICTFLFIFKIKTAGNLINNSFFICAFTIFIYLLIRLPFNNILLYEEDTQVADVYFNWPRFPDFWLQGQFHGRKVYSPFSHPTLPLYFLATEGMLAKALYDPLQYDDLFVSSYTRFFNHLPLLLVLVALLMYLKRYIKRSGLPNQTFVYPFTILVILGSSQLALDGSVSLHIDATIGVLFTGILTILLLYSEEIQSKYTKAIILLFAGMFMGLGKNEWSLILTASCCISLIHFGIQGKMKNNGIYIGILFTGLIFGNLISYFFDSYNYTKGFYIMVELAQKSSFVPDFMTVPQEHIIIRLSEDQSGFSFWSGGFKSNGLAYSIFILLILFNTIVLIRNFRNIPFAHTLLYYFSILFFFAFFLSDWGIRMSRYFTPAMVPMMTFTVFNYSKNITSVNWLKIMLSVILLTSAILSIRAYSLKINLSDMHEDAYYISSIKGKPLDLSCLNAVDITINKPKNVNYYVRCSGDNVANEHGKANNIPVCPKNQ